MQESKANFYTIRKYDILWYLDQILSRGQRDAAIQELPLILGISTAQFNRYLYAQHGQAVEITAVKLLAISEYLEQQIGSPIEMEMLINKLKPKNEVKTA